MKRIFTVLVAIGCAFAVDNSGVTVSLNPRQAYSGNVHVIEPVHHVVDYLHHEPTYVSPSVHYVRPSVARVRIAHPAVVQPSLSLHHSYDPYVHTAVAEPAVLQHSVRYGGQSAGSTVSRSSYHSAGHASGYSSSDAAHTSSVNFGSGQHQASSGYSAGNSGVSSGLRSGYSSAGDVSTSSLNFGSQTTGDAAVRSGVSYNQGAAPQSSVGFNSQPSSGVYSAGYSGGSSGAVGLRSGFSSAGDVSSSSINYGASSGSANVGSRAGSTISQSAAPQSFFSAHQPSEASSGTPYGVLSSFSPASDLPSSSLNYGSSLPVGSSGSVGTGVSTAGKSTFGYGSGVSSAASGVRSGYSSAGDVSSTSVNFGGSSQSGSTVPQTIGTRAGPAPQSSVSYGSGVSSVTSGLRAGPSAEGVSSSVTNFRGSSQGVPAGASSVLQTSSFGSGVSSTASGLRSGFSSSGSLTSSGSNVDRSSQRITSGASPVPQSSYSFASGVSPSSSALRSGYSPASDVSSSSINFGSAGSGASAGSQSVGVRAGVSSVPQSSYSYGSGVSSGDSGLRSESSAAGVSSFGNNYGGSSQRVSSGPSSAPQSSSFGSGVSSGSYGLRSGFVSAGGVSSPLVNFGKSALGASAGGQVLGVRAGVHQSSFGFGSGASSGSQQSGSSFQQSGSPSGLSTATGLRSGFTPVDHAGSVSYAGTQASDFHSTSGAYVAPHHLSSAAHAASVGTHNAVLSPEHSALIISQSGELNHDGSYHYSFQSDNGIHQEAVSSPVSSVERQGGGSSHAVRGSYSYTAPDGTPITVNYVADENGFHAEGAHLPVAPPVPEAIARSLEILPTLEESERREREREETERRQQRQSGVETN